jgi:hypothetical protein
MTNGSTEYNFEAEMAGFYAGGVLGGLFVGALGDLLKSEVHTMVWYVSGILLGGVAGAVAATIFRRLPQDQESLDPSP